MVFGLDTALNYLLQDAMGWLVFPITFTIPLFSSTIRKNQPLLLACWFTIFLHHAAAITNCYLFTLPGCDNDAYGMQAAAEHAGTRPGLDPLPYVIALRAIYQSIGVSQFLGSELSVCSFALSLLPFAELCALAKTRTKTPLLVLLFSCWPVTVINSSVTLRESHQVLAVLLVGWSLTALSARMHQHRAYLTLATGILMLFNLHRGLVFYSIAMASLAYAKLARNTMALLLSGTIVLGVLAGGLWVSESQQSAFARLSGGLDVSAAVTYRDNITGGRASYNTPIDTKSVPGFIFSILVCFFMYMFAPLPWMANGLPDLYALLESIFRMFMVAGLLNNIRESQGPRRDTLIMLAILFWSLELLWSIGTSNWGQAIRHRAVGYGFLVILGGDWWLDRLSKSKAERAAGKDQNLPIMATGAK